MKDIKYAAVIASALFGMSLVHAGIIEHYVVPFQNIEVKAASKIYANYNFDSNRQVLVCKANPDNDAFISVEWMYKDVSRKIELPVILKDNSTFTGHYADPEGQLTITNEFGSSTNNSSMFVSCEYQNKN